MPTLCAPAAEPEPGGGSHAPYPTSRGTHHDFTHWPLPIGRIEQRHGLTFVYSLAPGGFRIGDYCKVPDTNRVELWDGILVVYPDRDRRRRALARYFYELLEHMCEGELAPFIGPMDVPVSRSTVFAPDLVVFPRSGPPALVVEFRRDDTVKAKQERWAKLGGYARAGVRIYWAVDPETLTLRVYEREGRGRAVSHLFGRQQDAGWRQPAEAPLMAGRSGDGPPGASWPEDALTVASQPEGMPGVPSQPDATQPMRASGLPIRVSGRISGPIPGHAPPGHRLEIQDDPKVLMRVIEGLRRL